MVGTRPIRDSKETSGVYIDLNEIKDPIIIDTIYNIILNKKEGRL